MTNTRNNTIDFLRFLAAFTVCMFHFNEPIPFIDNGYRNLSKFGWLGVPVFFVISGFCIAQSADKSKNSLCFLTRRFFRIFPPFWFSLVVVMFSVITYKIIFGQNSVIVLPKTVESIISMYFKGHWSKVFILLVSAATFLYPFLQDFNIFFFLKHWAAFGLGISLFYFNPRYKKSYLIAFLTFAINLANLIYVKGLDSYTITVLITYGLISVSLWIKDLPPNFFSTLGDYSYSVYLLHVPLGVFLFGQLKSNAIQNNVYLNSVFDLVTYVLVASIAFFSFKHIELPFLNMGKKFAK